MEPNFKDIHLSFRFNGLYFNRSALKEVAYSLVKEGVPFEQSIGDFLIDWLNDKEYVEVKTSGTTGAPKLIELQKKHMVNSAIATGAFFNLSEGDTALHCLPSDYIAGKMMLVRALVLGLKIVTIVPDSNPLSMITDHYDFCAMVPLQVQNSYDKLTKIKTLIIGGAPISRELIESINKTSVNAYETYGMTETSTHIAAKDLTNIKNNKEANTYFNALPNVTFSLDERECLCIDAPLISDVLIKTNDIACLVSENSFQWLGRYDTVINSGGIKLIPEQIEKKLSSIIKNRFFITTIKDKKLGNKLVLAIEGEEKNKEEIIKAIKKDTTFSKYEIPKEIYFISHFKETDNGKLIRTLV